MGQQCLVPKRAVIGLIGCGIDKCFFLQLYDEDLNITPSQPIFQAAPLPRLHITHC